MKKTLLTLGVLGLMTMGLAACGDDNVDCNCTVKLGDEAIPLFTDKTPTFTDYDGDCSDINAENLPQQYENWRNIVELGGSLNCVED